MERGFDLRRTMVEAVQTHRCGCMAPLPASIQQQRLIRCARRQHAPLRLGHAFISSLSSSTVPAAAACSSECKTDGGMAERVTAAMFSELAATSDKYVDLLQEGLPWDMHGRFIGDQRRREAREAALGESVKSLAGRIQDAL